MRVRGMKQLMGLTGLAVLVAGSLQANPTFTGADPDNQLFSNNGNWDTFPKAGDNIIIGVGATSSGNPAQVDSGFEAFPGDPFTGANRLNTVTFRTGTLGTAYVEILNGAAIQGNLVHVGIGTARNGIVTVKSGGTLLGGSGGNAGLLEVAGGAGNILTIENGATYGGARLETKTGTILEVQAGSDAISTFSGTSATNPSSISGLFRLDLGELDTVGSYTLIDNKIAITGDLITWLDGNGGTHSGTGNFSHTNFEIINANSGLEWSLETADVGQRLVFNVSVIPEPATLGLFSVAFVVLFLLRRSHG